MFTAASRLLAPQLRTTTMLLTSTWLLNMMGYYGVVLLATEIHLSPEAAAGAADAAAGASSESATLIDRCRTRPEPGSHPLGHFSIISPLLLTRHQSHL